MRVWALPLLGLFIYLCLFLALYQPAVEEKEVLPCETLLPGFIHHHPITKTTGKYRVTFFDGSTTICAEVIPNSIGQ